MAFAADPKDVGRKEEWFRSPRPEAKRSKVPWIIQDAFPGYHGVAWYWRDFVAPANDRPGGRYLLRFWAVDYKSDVWLNNTFVGTHEGGESPFVLDVTGVMKADRPNRLAVRVLNPIHQPIDGIVLNETPHRNKTLPYSSGNAFDQGGIWDSVELIAAPAVRIDELSATPDWKTGAIGVKLHLRNTATEAVPVRVEFRVAAAAGGETLVAHQAGRLLPPGDTAVETELVVERISALGLERSFPLPRHRARRGRFPRTR